jgi:hypothetical protein
VELGKMIDDDPGNSPAPSESPARGTPESAAWFRAALEALGETQASMARLMKRKGDDRQPDTIARHMRRMATGNARVSGEMRVILTMMQRAKNRAAKRGVASQTRCSHDDIKQSPPGDEKRSVEKAADQKRQPAA